ncbi:MAG TPA: hypothetical protein VFD63_19625 [Pyrinomonadaceae bacterium]|nr:hypothetical protein [Pyrinomonadaceae bacterium]
MGTLQKSLGNIFWESISLMAISNELSSDIAAAILANQNSPQELRRLKDVVLEVHSTLQQMSAEARARRHDERIVQPAARLSSGSTTKN